MKRRSLCRAELQVDVDVGAAGERRERAFVAQHVRARRAACRGRSSDKEESGSGIDRATALREPPRLPRRATGRLRFTER